ncbi:nucleoside diphosphate-linked moiety X motif 13 [Callorhinchus milii]|uniref:NAD(+) diphosphatase n=1 Tax=Callorhinchus milii TaxID=7868 RepID=A0A4W3H3B7_CALMI|nr:nucleoside diphosphate-linked moiety X motif 13 [Callorhinchus milii]XP_007895757.1 nucleoside diphosphate-linked moiety X motif 13 [Callorhinchus milii]XP_007895765.1 nucleoside diphosphate-linked moiety X motif 13 [Callorhinchus milii]XP_007895775.1 nucleoside diphosphate-linked moiety X motif 13 [Callorhinchus milii]XP_042192563.1 nucleoside diphosphate-linked moiety X motif 13 [Callorhinchus milii]XP_042192564.1 nucleoside diphosphate-linked moiety X motif 13 [Callorhinchus milii]|eukprot:gi/632936692/ref/XP_007895741.1/ PREDICTED: nucleoside diphosphate-linked moiety X motif 13 isoform X1 [Callorhinchus milii]
MYLLLRNLKRLALPSSCRFISNYVSRMRHLFDLKENDEACRKALSSGSFLLFHSLSPLMQKTENKYTVPFVTASELYRILRKLGQKEKYLEESVLLGCTDSYLAQFALDLGIMEKAKAESLLQGTFVDLRKAFLLLDGKNAQMLSQAQALLRWHNTHLYCSKTGHPMQKNVSGSRRICSSNGTIYYPQMSPVIITLVSDGTRCLLARQEAFPSGMYSALAGFCDIGETVEQAVHREVAEEVGLEVSSSKYAASQHWPFPNSSLMIASHAMVQPGQIKITLNQFELEDARWFGAEELAEALRRERMPSKNEMGTIPFWIPPPWTIAHQLIKEWTQQKQLC